MTGTVDKSVEEAKHLAERHYTERLIEAIMRLRNSVDALAPKLSLNENVKPDPDSKLPSFSGEGIEPPKPKPSPVRKIPEGTP